MKKIPLCLFSICAVASAAPYYLPKPPGGGLTPYDWQPTHTLEGIYAIGTDHTPDTAEVLHGQPFMGRELMVSAASERPEGSDKPEAAETPEEKPATPVEAPQDSAPEAAEEE